MHGGGFNPERFGVSLFVIPGAGEGSERPAEWRAVKETVANEAARGLAMCSDPSDAREARSASVSVGFRLDAVVMPLDARGYDARHRRAFLHLAAHLFWRSLLIVRESDYIGGYEALLGKVVPRLCAHRNPRSTPRWLRVKQIARS